MNYLKSLGIVKKQKDAGYCCNYCKFECDSQLQMIHHNSSCFFSYYDNNKKRTGLRRSQVKEQEKKQKRVIRNILNSKIIKNNSIEVQNINKNLQNEEEEQKINILQDHNIEQVSDDKNDLIDEIQDDQFMIKGEENNFIISMIALKNRSDLRLSWDWPQHEKYTKYFKVTENRIDVKSTLEYTNKEITEQNCEFTSNDKLQQTNQNEELQLIQVDKDITNNQEISQHDIKQLDLVQTQEQIQNVEKPTALNDDNIQVQASSSIIKLQKQEIRQQFIQIDLINEESVIVKHHDLMTIQQNNSLENQDIKSEIIIKRPSKQESNIQSDDEDISFIDPNKASDQFYLILQQAHFELIHRNQLKEVHKILRDYYDQVRLDMLDIDKVWGLVQSKHSQAILNYRQLLKCLLDLHDQEKIQLDEHKQILYLI
ncbi:unnamed protein product [Paramecium pentaurelia]|uniref:Uncharacterized protein n=1 Tax=Paramecium pentaurelia TaxID=43138 RepID=A0A8S1US68_9CILI|nr:unnamed protein product [Paramecium pentaurelia]